MQAQPALISDRRHRRLFYEEDHFTAAWRRCVQAGAPLHGPRTWDVPTTATLAELRKKHRPLIDTAAPFLRTLQRTVETESSYAVLLVTACARILDVRTDRPTDAYGGLLSLFPGASVAEDDIGNNGPGTALVTGRAVRFSGLEHYNQCLTHRATMGVPIISPDGRIIGALGIFLPCDSRVCADAVHQLVLQAKTLGYVYHTSADPAPREPAPTRENPGPEQLWTAMRIMGGFAHEVRNPLAVIRGFAQLLLDGKGKNDDQADQYLSLIVDEVDRISERFKGLISLSSCKNKAHRELDIPTLMREVELLLRGSAFQNGARLVVETAPDTGAIRGHAEQLRQVILNLTYNALEAVPTDGAVTLRAAAVGDRVRITVTDNGTGIADEIMPRIFEPFFSTRHGAGLGLAISRDIIHCHGGTLTLASTPGEETTATITLPRQSAADAPSPVPSTPFPAPNY